MTASSFRVVLRGYDPSAVDAFLQRVEAGEAGAAEVMDTVFPIVMRGYDREEVDVFLDGVADRLRS